MIYKLDPLGDPRWPAFVDRHPNASVFHTSGWLEAVRRTYGYKPVVFTTSSPTHELRNGLLFCRVRSWLTGRHMVSLPFSDYCEPLCDWSEFEVLVRYLQSALDHQDWKYLELRLRDGCLSSQPEKVGFGVKDRRLLHRVSLTSLPDDLLATWQQDLIQCAERAGVVERVGNSERQLRDFYSLCLSSQKRQKLPIQPYKWFQNVAQCLGECLAIRTAYKDDLPVASIWTLRFRNTVYCKYGCSNATFKPLGAMPFLLSRATCEAKSSGATAFDLGRAEVGNDEAATFNNGCRLVPQTLTYWKFPGTLSDSVRFERRVKILKGLFSLMPSRLLIAAGKFLYPLIG